MIQLSNELILLSESNFLFHHFMDFLSIYACMEKFALNLLSSQFVARFVNEEVAFFRQMPSTVDIRVQFKMILVHILKADMFASSRKVSITRIM